AAREHGDRNRGPHVVGFDRLGLVAASEVDAASAAGSQLHGLHPRAELEARAEIARRLVQALADLAVAAPRVVEAAEAARLHAGDGGEDLASHLAERAGLDTAPRLGRGQLFGGQAPDLPRVRKVEIAADGAPKAA